MSLGELLDQVIDNTTIVLIDNGNYIATFLAEHAPEEYKKYKVNNMAPDYFEGGSPFDGPVLDVMISKTTK